jgi:glutamate synthase (NADPH/NADH) small chain
MPLEPILTAEQVLANLAEIEPAYSPQEARVEANRCLYCFDAPCIMACPTGIDIPAFIKKISHGQLTGSARTILESNVLGGSCARVCPTSVLCEGACVMLDRDQAPIKIGRLQRHAVDHVMDNDIQVLHPAEKKNGKKVALIGSGPASLGCAAELARLGYEAIVYEKSEEPGGLNTYGIAYYKLTPEVSLKEVELVRQLGVEFRTGVEVGRDISLAEIQATHDAVFLGIGLGQTYRLGIPGENLPGVAEALDFIKHIHTRPLNHIPVGRRVAVIGCGNTAIDAVTQAKRIGAEEAVIIYRRGEADMPAYAFEYALGRKDGCAFLFHAAPVAIEGDTEVTGITLIRTEPDGRGNVRPVPGSEFTFPCDMVIKALGQEKQVNLLESIAPGIALDRAGRIVIDPATGQTNLPMVFSGGDAVNGGREVVNAVADGKRAARGMHQILGGEVVEGPIQTTRLGVSGRPLGSGFDQPVRIAETSKAAFGTSSFSTHF